MPSKRDIILQYFSRNNDGQTAREIAEGIGGPGTKQQTVYSHLETLCAEQPRPLLIRKATDKGLVGYFKSAAFQNVTPATVLTPREDGRLRMKLTDASDKVLERLTDNHDRMHSWTHCFRIFQSLGDRPSEKEIDLAALHLAFYLASYGMYRGSTQLLQKDYRFLCPVIAELKTQKFSELAVVETSVVEATAALRAEKLWEQCEQLEEFLIRQGLKQSSMGTLVTKILLGTWCSVPAFDTAFRQALRKTGLGAATWSKKNLIRSFSTIQVHAPEFQEQVDQFHRNGHLHYPAIRVIDAIFWHLGGGDKKTEKGKVGI